jgi:hypothetical protein
LTLFALPVAGVSAAGAIEAGAAPASQGVVTGLFYTGDAYGTEANVGQTVMSGKSALVALGCTTTAGVHHANTIATVSVPGVLTTGAVDSTADTLAITGGVESTTSSDVHDVNVIAGVITADEVTAVSATSHDGTGFHVTDAGSGIVNLAINGVPVTAAPPPNTTIPLPGVGSVVLNEQVQHIGANTASFTVNMIHVNVTAALPGIAPGTQIIVAHATSDLELNKAGPLDGHAYGTAADVSGLVVSGRTALVIMPCGGTRGAGRSNDIAGVSVPGVVSTGTVTDTAQGTVSGQSASGETTSTVQTANLLAGVVTADLITADAHASNAGGTITLGDTGSTFGNLVVNGQSFPADVPPNTMMSGGGLTIWLHRVIQRSNSIEVRMIEVIVTGPNAGGLQIGLDLRVAVAEASVH